MDLSLITSNVLQPPVLFFLLGLLATAVRSDLAIPQPIPKLLSMALLLTIGFRGGAEVAHGQLTRDAVATLVAAVVLASLLPVYVFFVIRWRLDVFNAAAIAAAYGSVSAITFITAVDFLNKHEIAYGGHMIAGMALMESPAIIVAVLLVRFFAPSSRESATTWPRLLHDATLNGSVLLLLGSFAIGFLTGERGAATLKPLTSDLFPVLLTFFLLDMGLVAGKRFGSLIAAGPFLIFAALLIPLVNATVGLGIAAALGLRPGDALLLITLTASASYIAVPAAVRLAIPEANPSIYVSMSLAITFPFNIIVGIPAYFYVVQRMWS